MEPTKEQVLAGLGLIRDLTQERINAMGPSLQAVVIPSSQAAFSVIGKILDEHFKPTTPEPTPP